MADEKISAMGGVSEFANADIFPIVQAGGNQIATKLQIFNAAIGEDTFINGATGQTISIQQNGLTSHVEIEPTGDINVISQTELIAGTNTGPNLCSLSCFGDGSVVIDFMITTTFTIEDNFTNNPFVIDGPGSQVLVGNGAGYAVHVDYLAGNSGNWAGLPPTDLAIALDRIVQWITTHGGGTHP